MAIEVESQHAALIAEPAFFHKHFFIDKIEPKTTIEK